MIGNKEINVNLSVRIIEFFFCVYFYFSLSETPGIPARLLPRTQLQTYSGVHETKQHVLRYRLPYLTLITSRYSKYYAHRKTIPGRRGGGKHFSFRILR